MRTDSIDLTSALSRHFGFSAFRPGQEEIIARILGGENVLVVMPTGAGKSLCYQLPAVMSEGTALVVSPLIALMKDQLDALAEHGVAATFINSSIPVGEQLARLEQMRGGRYKLVYVAPERFRSPSFARSIAATDITSVVIDEAHCISEWGHDFRPDYLHLKQAIHVIAETRPSVNVIAFTATATRRVQQDIVRQLGVAGMQSFVTGFNRENLFFEVRYANKPDDKYRLLKQILTEEPADSSGIIYCGTRRDSEEVAQFVKADLKRSADSYHAGLPADVRRRAHDKFRSGEVPIFAATNAFGMGVDKPDIRFVIHFSIPQSAEAYYQEAGRAGRDGAPARCSLVYCPDDRSLIEYLIRAEVPTGDEVRSLFALLDTQANDKRIARLRSADIERLLAMRDTKSRSALHQLELAKAVRRHVDSGLGMNIELTMTSLSDTIVGQIERNLQQRLAFKRAQFEQIARYAETNQCRRQYLLAYFGETLTPSPSPAGGRGEPSISPSPAGEKGAGGEGCCDNCEQTGPGSEPELSSELARVAPVILNCISRLRFGMGSNKIGDVLRGSKAKWVAQWNLERNRYYGALAHCKSETIRQWIDELLEAGLLKRVGGEQPVLALTPSGLALVKRNAVEWPSTAVREAPQDRSDVTRPSVDEHLLRREIAGAQPSSRMQSAIDGESTIFATLRVFREGKSLSEIAQARGLSLTTVSSHLAELVQIGSVQIAELLDDDTRARIDAAVAQAGVERLKPIKELLPEEITYEQIRWAVAAHAFAAGMTSQPVDTSRDEARIATVEVPAQLNGDDAVLIAELKRWRLTKARERGVAPYVILHDAHLRSIAAMRPRTTSDLLRIKGVGDKRAQEYGEQLIAIVAGHVASPAVDVEPARDEPSTITVASSVGKVLHGPWTLGLAVDYSGGFVGANYERTEIGDLVYRYKYRGEKALVRDIVMRVALMLRARSDWPKPDLIVAVPPTQTDRGYDPVSELARLLADALRARWAPHLLARAATRRRQKEVNTPTEKRENVAGAFAVPHPREVAGQTVLLVDDFFDSGETLAECARALARAGATSVCVVTAAKTIHH